MVSTLSAAIRLFPSETAAISGAASWLTPLAGVVPLLLNFKVLNIMFKNNTYTNFGEVIEASLGRIMGKIIIVIFLLWMIILYFLYIRYYADRLLSSIYTSTDVRFFLLIMMLLVFMTTRGRIEAFTRFAEFSFLAFNAIMFAFFVLLLPSVKIENILPVTYYDIVPVIRASYPIAGIWCYLPLFFFIGDKVTDKGRINSYSKRTAIYLFVMNTLLIITVVGSIGPKVVQRMPLPFFNAVKVITFSELFDRMESVLLSVWVVSDFLVINSFAFIIMAICKQLFRLKEDKFLSAPLAFLGYSGSQFLTTSRFELKLFSNKIGLPINIITCILLPFIIMIIGKLRKKL
jgi:hypothetical protein